MMLFPVMQIPSTHCRSDISMTLTKMKVSQPWISWSGDFGSYDDNSKMDEHHIWLESKKTCSHDTQDHFQVIRCPPPAISPKHDI